MRLHDCSLADTDQVGFALQELCLGRLFGGVSPLSWSLGYKGYSEQHAKDYGKPYKVCRCGARRSSSAADVAHRRACAVGRLFCIFTQGLVSILA